MLPTSERYREVMQESFRPRGYARISYGIINAKASENQIIFSSNENWGEPQLINEYALPELTYATFEKNRFKTKLNSGFKIKPTDALQYEFKEHFISDEVSDLNGNFVNKPYIEVIFDEIMDLYGLTLTFDKLGNTYPSDIEITSYTQNDEIIKKDIISGIDVYEYIYQYELQNVKKINVIINKMAYGYQRFRLNRLEYGIYQIFNNKDFDSSSAIKHVREISPTSVNLSNSSLSFTIFNSNNDYNALNPQGLWRYVEESQPVRVEFGRDVDGIIEWLEVDNLVLDKDIVAKQNKATFKAVDKFSTLKGTYYKGKYNIDGISLYDLAVDVLANADVSPAEYVIDERLKDINTKGILPVMLNKEALQIIANASNSIVFADSKGRINIEVAFDPKMTVSDNGHSLTSQVDNIVNGLSLPSNIYATLDKDSFETQSKNLQIVTPHAVDDYLFMGYSSDVACDDLGIFQTKKPRIEIKYSMPIDVFQMPITFNNVMEQYATSFLIIFENDYEELDRVLVENNIEVTYFLEKAVIGVTKIYLEINSWSTPNQRAVVNQFGEGRINDFYMDFRTSKQKPEVDKSRLIRNLQMSYFSTNISTETTEVKLENNLTKYLEVHHDPMNDIIVTLSSGNIVSQEHYAYYSIIEVDSLNIEEIKLVGNKINIVEQKTIISYNNSGEDKTFSNPLVSGYDRALSVANWVYDFLLKNNSLNIEYRGNPELEPFDTIYVQSEFNPYTPTRILRTEITFGSSTSGKVEVVNI